MAHSLIYDFETLSQDGIDGAIVSLAALKFDDRRFVKNPYEYDELLNDVYELKFDIEDQVKNHNRKIQKSTLEWWKKQDKAAIEKLKPSPDDLSIEVIYDFMTKEMDIANAWRVYTRGNSFDPVFFASVCKHFGHEDPTKWWNIRDTRSLFDGMTWGYNISNKFIPEEYKDRFVAHDPAHDIVMDVIRFQTLVRSLSE